MDPAGTPTGTSAGPGAGTSAETCAGNSAEACAGISSACSVGSLAAFSVDVEDYFQVEALRPFCPRTQWESFADRTEPNTERVLGLLEACGAKGTFFVLGWTAQRHPDLVRRIAAAGHEIASHGFDHELVYNQEPEDFRQDVRRARQLLQDLSGQEVIGYRAPSYTIMTRTLWALPILAQEGYRYDSSIFPILRRRYGMPSAKRWPHRIDLDDGGSIVEFPLPTLRLGLFNLPATGGAYLRLLPMGLQRWSVRGMLRGRRPFVLNIHPWELDPGQPRFPVKARTRWTHYHNLDRAEDRVRALLSMAAFRTQAEVLGRSALLPDQGSSLIRNRRGDSIPSRL
jgi:polysaccharide deacetylase family protein (PEP-CTERM system associated)